MTYGNKIIITFMLMFLAWASSEAQVKIEREYRINRSDVPEKALNFIDSTHFTARIKWYAEESQDGRSIEAKTRFRGTRYSVEFDTTGEVQDVEVTMKFNELEPIIEERITTSLNESFNKLRIVKIQKQWTGPREVLIELINSNTTDKKYKQLYEVYLSARENGALKYYEVLLDGEGTILKKMESVQKNTQNLEF
jgi:hypothetical protein